MHRFVQIVHQLVADLNRIRWLHGNLSQLFWDFPIFLQIVPPSLFPLLSCLFGIFSPIRPHSSTNSFALTWIITWKGMILSLALIYSAIHSPGLAKWLSIFLSFHLRLIVPVSCSKLNVWLSTSLSQSQNKFRYLCLVCVNYRCLPENPSWLVTGTLA